MIRKKFDEALANHNPFRMSMRRSGVSLDLVAKRTRDPSGVPVAGPKSVPEGPFPDNPSSPPPPLFSVFLGGLET